MKRATIAGGVFAMLCAMAASLPAQSAQPKARPEQKAVLDMVQVVGCLTEGPTSTWTLTDATAPTVTEAASTTTAAVKLAESTPLGTMKYRLLGVSELGPERHKGHKVVVKGLLIKAPNDNRINGTSLQMLSATCAK